jgi:2-iminobutanoate/2-iminopropanoate deaminase
LRAVFRNHMRKLSLIGLSVAGFAGLVFGVVMFLRDGGVSAQAVRKRAIEAWDAPKAVGPYSHAIVANGMVYTAGQVGADPKTGNLVEGGIERETEQALKNIEGVLRMSGVTMSSVVKTTVFLADMNDFAKMNEIYAKRFPEPFPARSTVQVARLPRDARVEIEVVALAQP